MILFVCGVLTAGGMLATVLLYRAARRRGRVGSLNVVVAANLLLVGTLLSASFGALEAYMRFGFEGTDNFGATPATEEWIKKYYHKNNWGWRDNADYSAARTPDKTCLTFLGDSSTEGAGIKDVDRRFANLIRLRNSDRYDVQVFARGGNSTGNELRDLLDAYRSKPYRADVVVLMYDLNDITDLSSDYLRWESTGYERTQAAMNRPGVRSSALLTLLVARRAAARYFDVSEYAKMLEQCYERIEWQKQKLRLRLLNDLSADHGAQLVIVSLPSHYPASEKLLGEWCRGFQVPFLGLQSVYDAEPTANWSVSASDDHPNERAHAAFASRIEAFLATVTPRAMPTSSPTAVGEFAALSELDWCDSAAVFTAMAKYLEARGDSQGAQEVSALARQVAATRPASAEVR
jgi:lysophospholipase L1-like esterase